MPGAAKPVSGLKCLVFSSSLGVWKPDGAFPRQRPSWGLVLAGQLWPPQASSVPSLPRRRSRSEFRRLPWAVFIVLLC